MKGYNYGGKASTPIVRSLTNETSKVTYYYKHTNNPDSSYRAGFPTEVGEYTLKAVLPETIIIQPVWQLHILRVHTHLNLKIPSVSAIYLLRTQYRIKRFL